MIYVCVRLYIAFIIQATNKQHLQTAYVDHSHMRGETYKV